MNSTESTAAHENAANSLVTPAASPNGLDAKAHDVIPDPDVEGDGSKYAASGTFGSGPTVRANTPVTIGKSRTFMRVKLDLAREMDVVDTAAANSVGKNLYLLIPAAARAGALAGVLTGYRALFVPCIDRDGAAFLWDIRRTTRDGAQLDSYNSAVEILPLMAEEWSRLQWQGSGYTRDIPYNPAALGEPKWPTDLKRFDDWAVAAFRGKIIDNPNHIALQRMRGEV